MMKFFVQFGMFGQWFESREEAERFCRLAGYGFDSIVEMENEEEA